MDPELALGLLFCIKLTHYYFKVMCYNHRIKCDRRSDGMIIEINEQMIHYTVHGEGLPLIILHGFYLDSITMKRAIEDSKISLKGFKRIYIDMPGMGQSPRHNLENSSDTMLELLCNCITALIADRPFIIMGFSYGGYIAKGVARKFLGQVIGEVLICPVVVTDPSKRQTEEVHTRDIDDAYFKTLTQEQQANALATMVVINERTVKRSEADFARARALADATFLEALFTKRYSSTYIDSDEMVHPHKSLIFLGYQDRSVGYKDMLDRLNQYPKATVNLLTNASHSFFLEQPTQFEYILASWLSQYK